MTKTPIPEIRASGFIKLTSGESSAILVCENSIKATLSEETRDITPSHIGNPSATFGSKESLIGEVSFKMFGDELGEGKLSIATIASAFEFEEDAGA